MRHFIEVSSVVLHKRDINAEEIEVNLSLCAPQC